MMPRTKFWGRFCLLLVLLICAFAVWGQTPGTGLVCDTADEVKEVIMLKRQPNDQSGACGVLGVVYKVVKSETFTHQGQDYLITEVLVEAVHVDGVWLRVDPPMKQFTFFAKPKKGTKT